ncbi:MAG TPA: hypothetical protein VK335_14040 [Bryobacteraceae bacterium]|nr:hypothetical protein [Bryobacteraceae bacterium]HXR15476.1 hypothetical protein [Terriglobales bacterium]
MPAASKPAARKRAAAPKPAPAIWINTATPDGVVTGHTTDPNHMVRITVSKEGGEVRTEPNWPLPSGDFTIPLLLLKSGWIVQAWVISGNTDLAHSAAKAVADSTSEDDPPPAMAAISSMPAPSSPAPAAKTPQAQPAAMANKQKAKAPASVCDDGNPDTDAKLALAAGDSEIQGRTYKFASASGTVSVCVNGQQRQIRDTKDEASVAGSLKDSKFDVTFSSGPALAQGNFVLVALQPAHGERTTIQGVVGPSKKIIAGVCDSTVNKDQQIYAETIRAGTSEITAMVPASSGSVTVCVNDEQVDIAAGPAPSKGSPTYANKLDITTPKVELLLKSAVSKDELVRIAWLSKDQTQRVTKDVTVEGTKFSRVLLRSVPKEGDTKLIVDVDPPPASSGTDSSKSALSLSVFVNGDGVPLVNTKGSEIQSEAVDSSGETGLTLKNPVDGGDCVVVLEHAGPILPSDIDFNKLICEARNRPQTVPPPSQRYSQSYPFLAHSIFDWGRVRGYMAAGGLFSFDNNSFSDESIFLGMNMTKNWVWGGPFWQYDENGQPTRSYKRVMFETFFDARLTSLPVAACTASTPSTTPTGGGTTTSKTQSSGGSSGGGSGGSTGGSGSSASSPAPPCPNTVATFITARKSATLTGGASIPFLFPTWHYSARPYALSLGPVAKVGFETPISDIQSDAVSANEHEFYTNFGLGTRLGLYRMSYSTDVAPELESYVDVVTGRFSNFDISPPDGVRYARPWRIGVEGFLKVPMTPFILGFGANIHQNFGLFNSKTVDNAKDSLQFLFGAKFDAGKLFSKIGSIK